MLWLLHGVLGLWLARLESLTLVFFFFLVALGLCWCLRAFSSCRELGLLCLAAHGLPVAGFPGGSDGKESACNTGDLGSIRELGRSPGEGNGNPLQYSSLENSMDRGTWQSSVHGIIKSRTQLKD